MGSSHDLQWKVIGNDAVSEMAPVTEYESCLRILPPTHTHKIIIESKKQIIYNEVSCIKSNSFPIHVKIQSE